MAERLLLGPCAVPPIAMGSACGPVPKASSRLLGAAGGQRPLGSVTALQLLPPHRALPAASTSATPPP